MDTYDPDPVYLVNRTGSGTKIHRPTCSSVRHQVGDISEPSWFHPEFYREPEYATKSEVEQFRTYTGCGQCKPDITPFTRRSDQPCAVRSIGEKHIGRDFVGYGRLESVRVVMAFDTGKTTTFTLDEVLEYRVDQ